MPTAEDIELVELDGVSLQDWVRLTGRDRGAFGAGVAELAWRPKDRHVGAIVAGELVAVGGVAVAPVEIAGHGTREVVGVGGVVVAPAWRRRGVGLAVMDAVGALADTAGPDWAMIFCREELVGLYERRRYHRIADPVWVDQPEERIVMPLPAMWRPVRPGATWPRGRVDLRGLPF